MEGNGRRARNAEETRGLLVATARRMFSEQGFGATTVEDVLRGAGVAKGALYHHFAGKDDLLRAVAAELGSDLTAQLERARLRKQGPWERVEVGCQVLLDACLDPEVQRVLVLDHPAVLGGTDRSPLADVVDVLRADVAAAALAEGNPCHVPLEPLAAMLSGALQEGALLVARSERPHATRKAVGQTTAFLLRSIRAQLLTC